MPLLVLVVAGIDQITDDRVAAAAASDLVDVVELQRDAAAVLPRAQLERVALSGLAAVDDLGLPRDLIASFTGLDFEEIYSSNATELDLALDRLQRRHGDVELTDGTRFVERLGFLRGSLQVQRDLSADGRASADDVGAVFEDIDALFGEVLAADLSSGATADLDRHRIRLAALGDVLLSGGEVARVTIDHLISESDGVTGPEIAHAIHRTHIEVFESYLDPVERAEFRANVSRRDGYEPVEFDMPSLMTDPTAIESAAQAVLSELDGLEALTVYSDGFHDRTAADVRADAEGARSRSLATTGWLVTIAVITLASIALVLWSILRPLRRLTKRARQVSSGVLDQPPLPVRGPRDVRALTSTMNDMASALDRVNHHIGRMAAGEASIDGATDLPGPIGVGFRSSVVRLAAVTEQLQRSEALSTAIVEQADDAIWTVDDRGNIISANAASARLTGVDVGDQIGRPIDELLERTNGEAAVLTRAAPRRRVLVAQSVIDIGDERVTAVIAHDISERAEFEERLAYQAKHDALTALPNRFAVLEHLAELSAEHAGHVAVLYLDLDGFKSVNDAQGHAVGDRVLTQVGATISRAVRHGEFVGRLGGDEFVVVTHRFTQLADVVALAHRIVREVELPQDVDGKLFALSASVGIAVPPADVEPLDMIGQADAAVYQAKQRGRGLVELFDHEMQLSIERTSEIERSLLPAIAHGELELHLQPIIDLRSGTITGAEALVRWRRPGFGLVPPGDFIPVAERSSLILDLDRWVLTEGCRLLADWKRRAPDRPITLSVNVSGRHLVDGDLLADVEAALGMTGADAGRLTLELTETHLLEDLDGATAILQQLRARGVKIAVDDFGTGYSSMTYLRSLPIDTLKIDRSFVSRATEHGFDSTVVEAILTIARALDLRVVAEGVETDDQLQFVRARGCDEAQGFLLARPMPIEDAEARMLALDALDRVV